MAANMEKTCWGKRVAAGGQGGGQCHALTGNSVSNGQGGKQVNLRSLATLAEVFNIDILDNLNATCYMCCFKKF